MIYYVVAYVYMALLAALTTLIVVGRQSSSMTRTILAIAGNYVISFAYTWTTKDPDPWPLFMALDFATALVILIRPAGRAQAIIGLTYIMQIAIHTSYALAGSGADGRIYWWLITAFAFLQLILIGGWWANVSGYRFRRLRRHRARPLEAHKKGVE